MVELIDAGESRTTKLKRDVRKILGLAGEARAEIDFKGSPKARALQAIDWYQDRTACGHCASHPETSFSTRVRVQTEQRGVAAGTAEFLRLWRARTAGRLV